jgi:hypothetical protein
MQKTRRRTADAFNDSLLELARIFAQGVLRLHERGHLPPNANGLSLETPLKTVPPDLEQSQISRLSVTRG